MLILKFFPAEYGDCCICEFPYDKKTFRILVDGGTAGSVAQVIEYLNGLPPEDNDINLVVVTHIDNDHIGGVIKALRGDGLRKRVGEFWFNGYRHLPKDDIQRLSVPQGMDLEALLNEDNRWNHSAQGNAIAINDDGSPRKFGIATGVNIYVVSPGRLQLTALRKTWQKVLDERDSLGLVEADNQLQRLGNVIDIESLAAKPFQEDTAPANGSSIAFLLEVSGRHILFAADAFPNVVCDAAETIWKAPLSVDVFKMSHHGSKSNTNERIIRQFPAAHYVISTNGKIYKHPDDEAIARGLFFQQHRKSLVFNYPHIAARWDRADLKEQWGYDVITGDGKSAVTLTFPVDAT